MSDPNVPRMSQESLSPCHKRQKTDESQLSLGFRQHPHESQQKRQAASQTSGSSSLTEPSLSTLIGQHGKSASELLGAAYEARYGKPDKDVRSKKSTATATEVRSMKVTNRGCARSGGATSHSGKSQSRRKQCKYESKHRMAALTSSHISEGIGSGTHHEKVTDYSHLPTTSSMNVSSSNQRNPSGKKKSNNPPLFHQNIDVESVLEKLNEKPLKPLDLRPDQVADAKKCSLGNYDRFQNKNYELKWKDDRICNFKKEWFFNRKCLDLGCADGAATILIAINFEPKKITGVDIDFKMISKAVKNMHFLNQMVRKKTSQVIQDPVTVAQKAATIEENDEDKDLQDMVKYENHINEHRDKTKELFNKLSRLPKSFQIKKTHPANWTHSDIESSIFVKPHTDILFKSERASGKMSFSVKSAGHRVAPSIVSDKTIRSDISAMSVISETSRHSDIGDISATEMVKEEEEEEEEERGGSDSKSQNENELVSDVASSIATLEDPAKSERLWNELFRFKSLDISQLEFPKNTQFKCENFLAANGMMNQGEKVEAILCLSVSKWIHLNWGDAGMERLFRSAFAALEEGGVFIFEPQPWSSYKKNTHRDRTLRQNLKKLKLRPQEFTVLLAHIGFVFEEKLKPTILVDSIFKRPIYVYKKPFADASKEL